MNRRSLLARMGKRARLVVAALVTAAVAITLTPAPAAAQMDPPWRIPPGGWCYDNSFVVNSVVGQVHEQYGPTKHFDNQSSVPVTWTESISVTHTFRSTTTTTTTFEGGVDFWIIKSAVRKQTTVQIEDSITVNETSSMTVTVPPHTLMFAAYGAFKTEIRGTYGQLKYECGTYNYDTYISGPVTVYALESVGWSTWDA